MDLGVDAGSIDDDSNTPLFFACEGEPDIVVLLLNAGCPIDHQNHRGRNALMCGISFGDFESVSCLVTAGADCGLCDADGRSAEAIAREAGSSAILELVRNAGAPADDE